MSNPSFAQIFATDSNAVNNALTSLGLPATTDARTAAASILDLLSRNYTTLTDGGVSLQSYTITQEFENVDLTTQNQNFTITLERAISVGGVIDEPA